jgi:hypothetical protein
MRQKWLEEILKTNLENQDTISAFITQLRIIALVDTVVDCNRQQHGYTPPKNDTKPPFHLCIVRPVHWVYPELPFPVPPSVLGFWFMPELLVKTEIPFAKMHGRTRICSKDSFQTLLSKPVRLESN